MAAITADIKLNGETRTIELEAGDGTAWEAGASAMARTFKGNVLHPASIRLVARKFGPITASDGTRWALAQTVAMNRPAQFVSWND